MLLSPSCYVLAINRVPCYLAELALLFHVERQVYILFLRKLGRLSRKLIVVSYAIEDLFAGTGRDTINN